MPNRKDTSKRAGTAAGKGESKNHSPASAPAFSPAVQELRALLRRVPDGFQATLHSLAVRPAEERERCLSEMARGLGREILPLFRAAALSPDRELARSAIGVLPVFGTRAAGELLLEVMKAGPDPERTQWLLDSARAFQARGVNIVLADDKPRDARPRLVIREASVSSPDGVGSRSVAVHLQDGYGVWHAIFVMWNDRVGVKDGFRRPFSRRDWEARLTTRETRGLQHHRCPVDYSRWLVHQCRSRNETSGFPLGESLVEWDHYIGPPPAGYVPPDPVQELGLTDPVVLEEALAAGLSLFERPDLAGWFLEAADCVPWMREYHTLTSRMGGDSQAATISRHSEIATEAAAVLIGHADCPLIQARMEEMARILIWEREPEAGRRCAAIGAALASGRTPADIPFLRHMVARTLLVCYQMLLQGEDPDRTRYRPMRRYQIV